jgi:type IV secretory pathway VirB10-like protein
MEFIYESISSQINYMKKLILMALPALFALSAFAQKKEEVKKVPPKVVKVEKAKEVKASPQKAKIKTKKPPEVNMEKFVPPPPPPTTEAVYKGDEPAPPPPPKVVRAQKKAGTTPK